MAAAKEFNIGAKTLLDFLASKNFSVDDLKPTSKLTEQMYRVLQAEFQGDKAAKQKAQQIDLPKGASPDGKKKKDEEDLSIKKKEDKSKAKVKEAEVEKEQPAADPVISNVEVPDIEQPKVIAKIDLDSIDSSTRPKKTTKKKTTEEPPVEPAPAKEEPTPPPAPEAPAVIENIQAAKLTGPKILGKIELPVDNDTRPKRDADEKHKRKRIPIQKKPGTETIRGTRAIPDGQQDRGRGARTGRGPAGAGSPRRDDRIIDEKEIQEKLRQTQAKLAAAGGRGKSVKAKLRRAKREEMAEASAEGVQGNKLQVTEFISVAELANLMDVSFADVISKCMELGIMVSINQRLEADVIELVASEFNFEVEFIGVEDATSIEEEEEEDDEEDLLARPPIVTIMGHVDHGKTSLLDYIRNTNVIAGEAGGITQHIGAYEVTTKEGRNITFLDTPGHEAFTAMRARGAKVTDLAVIVVAADDAVMPQTKEAISHAQAANVPMIFAINKIDKDGANPEKIKEQLSAMNILVESWGGKFQSQEISAKKGLNVDLLLEKILLEADILDLKANPEREAKGTIIEASLDKGRGYVATILVQNGTLRVGDMIVSGQYFGKVKAMYNERNQRVEEAPPSTPVLLLGLNGAPQAGETFRVFDDESEAREMAYKRGQLIREQGIRTKKHITLDEIGRRLALGNFKELNVIIKGDVDGSVEALSDSLQKLSTGEIVVKVIHKAVGAITESDVTLANASDAIIIGFNVRPTLQASRLAENESIQIKMYSIIYNAIEEVKSAMEGMLEPRVEEKILGNLEIRQTYKFDKATVAGCFMLDGKIARNNNVRLIRDGIVIYTGELASLKRFKDDVKEVLSGMECGLVIKNYNDIKVGDVVEAFEEIEVKRTL
jgi:translation initiation factor IF-2